MRSRRVAKGHAARERRYTAAVLRQIAMAELADREHRPYFYADPEEMLRRGDTLDRFRGQPRPAVRRIGARPCGCRWFHYGNTAFFTARCDAHTGVFDALHLLGDPANDVEVVDAYAFAGMGRGAEQVAQGLAALRAGKDRSC